VDKVLPIEQEDAVLHVPGERLSNANDVGIMGSCSSQRSRSEGGVEGGRQVGFSVTGAKCVEQRRGLFSSKSSSNSVRVFCLRRSPLLWRDGIIPSRGRCWPWWCEPGLLEGRLGAKGDEREEYLIWAGWITFRNGLRYVCMYDVQFL
jgi:hypothetical protein